ncbi:MAG TPA: ribosomal L7Ae/L30e/S12e/Gadd45 family protein [Thermotogota bacterium]|jgi:ribosomal protein L7Ae-like RNA K-turn-binding protein|nr:50S ribosomal protein L7ae family protein [Thermotogaceae bacterium]OQC31404.1 MAG: ribosomal protein L7Ae family protein [Thermotogota bacterium ADurb.Bin062]HNW46437.1 ribosomal L7Ae/L30e/S12e/Gadd45 family protein [Thermotogota bacterium]HOD91142.1 ribosomal L7Ae/L30e/S12e/Gadd45 family protein [Thermotogota bacterium]HOF24076.1 ribosomal L7Ae/L30e/S12e/Gadd45 family protein [Thermotogota bacterium]
MGFEGYYEIKKDQELAGFLGIAAKTKKIVVGKDHIKSYLKTPKITKKLLILACDISEGQKKDWMHRGSYAGAKILYLCHTPKTLLAKAIGKTEVSAVAIADDRLIDGLVAKLGLS